MFILLLTVNETIAKRPAFRVSIIPNRFQRRSASCSPSVAVRVTKEMRCSIVSLETASASLSNVDGFICSRKEGASSGVLSVGSQEVAVCI